MKNKMLILIMITIISIAIIFTVVINKINRNEIDEEKIVLGTLIKETQQYKKIEKNKIKRIEILEATESQRDPIYVEDKEKVDEIYERIGNIVIDKISYIRTTDSELYYKFELENEDIVRFSFEGSNIVIGKKQYNVKGLSKLKSIQLQNTEDN